jgi:hypothetical protein
MTMASYRRKKAGLEHCPEDSHSRTGLDSPPITTDLKVEAFAPL